MPIQQLSGTPTRGLLGSVGARDSIRHNGVIKKTKETRPTFDELKAIEKTRREILLRAELPYWRIILFWSGTCLKEISTDVLVWLSMAIYSGIRIYASTIDYVPQAALLAEKTNIGVLGGFLSFFLVLFVNQTNGRFLEMYGFVKACSGRIQDVAGLAKAQLPPQEADRLVKHFNAAQIAGYVGLNAIGQGSPYSKAHFFDVYNAKHYLLTDDEMEELEHHDMDHSGLFMKEMCTWCQEDVAEYRKAGYLDSYQEKFMHDRILAFRAAMDGMYDYTDQPPHFFYIHFLCFLSLLYLPLFAIDTGYSAGWGDEVYIGLDLLNGLIVFLQCIFVVGLRSLATKMIDPFGDDYEDLSVILYVEATLEICDTILNSSRPSRSSRRKKPPSFNVGGASSSETFPTTDKVHVGGNKMLDRSGTTMTLDDSDE